MLFSSHIFLFCFLPLVWLGFFASARWLGTRAAVAWLTLASFFFYGWWEPRYLWVVTLSIAANYAIGCWLGRLHTKNAAHSVTATLSLALGVALNLGFLGYFKYVHFLAENINLLLGTGWPVLAMLLPLGISFFTFEQIAFLIDARKGRTRGEGFLDYCLFVSFFPHLLAGPIVYHKDLIPQFSRKRFFVPQLSMIAAGLSLFFIGLCKKSLLADHAALYANPVFDSVARGGGVTFFEAWLAAFSYSFQLYFDFSGYSDMAIGIAMLFGVTLPVNFLSPYKATSIIDFWRRWHITLSNFLRDYLYIPFGGNRKGIGRGYLNLMLTMLLGGLWHGAGWNFIFWGGLHGAMLCINHLWRHLAGNKEQTYLRRLGGRLLTFFCVVVAWVWFRADSAASASLFMQAMFDAKAAVATLALPFPNPNADYRTAVLWVAGLWAIAWLAPNSYEFLGRAQHSIRTPALARLRWSPSPLMALGIAAVALLGILSMSSRNEFLYFNF